MDKDDDSVSSYILIIFVFLCLISIVFELVLLGIAFFGADKVECNLLWCSFTTTRSEGITHQISYRDCFENGVRINCSLNDKRYDSLKCFDYQNTTYCKGVFNGS